TSRSFWRYWVSATDKFIPKSGAECRVKEAPDIELGVSEQAIHLFNRMFTFETVGQGEATNRQGGIALC
ncbi:hypothetical protein, partial [Aeromonas veronii]|uniref:hypothetical protein n=1 Tax=Aeromonas veronii TaxID=654 RepID=UPI003D233605